MFFLCELNVLAFLDDLFTLLCCFVLGRVKTLRDHEPAAAADAELTCRFSLPPPPGPPFRPQPTAAAPAPAARILLGSAS